MIKAYVLIEVEKGEAGSVVTEITGKPGILAADIVFGQYDVIATVEANDLGTLEQIVRDYIVPANYVARTQTLLVVPGVARAKPAEELSE